MTTITLISGGALGADSVWSYIAEKHGIKTIHLIGSGLSRPTGGIDDNRIREQRSGINQAITYEQTAEAIKGLIANNVIISGRPAKEYFRGELTTAQKLHARNYWQVEKGQQVLAVCNLANGMPTGGTATAVNLAIKLNKPTYVLNTQDQEWYEYNGTKFIPCDTPKLKIKNTCIGSRSLVKYKVCKYGKWVYAPYVGETIENKLRAKMEEVFNGI